MSIETEPGTTPVWSEVSRDENFLEQFTQHVKRTAGSVEITRRTGPMISDIDAVIDELSTEIFINTMGSSGIEISMPTDYRPIKTEGRFTRSKYHPSTSETYIEKRLEGLRSLAGFVEYQAEAFNIPLGLTRVPATIAAMDGQQSCARAVFHSIVSDLLEESVPTPVSYRALKTALGKSDPYFDEELLPILVHPDFEDQYGWRCQANMFGGLDLDSLKKILTHLKARKPEARLYCALGLLSGRGDLYRRHSTLHTALLEYAATGSVSTIEPRRNYPGNLSDLRVHKSTGNFLRRWASASFQGYVVIAEKTADQ